MVEGTVLFEKTENRVAIGGGGESGRGREGGGEGKGRRTVVRERWERGL